MPLPCGTLNQAKWLPLHLISGGLTIEAELDDYGVAFLESGPCIITGVNRLANLHEIDSSLANNYASHVLRGGPPRTHYSSVVSQFPTSADWAVFLREIGQRLHEVAAAILMLR